MFSVTLSIQQTPYFLPEKIFLLTTTFISPLRFQALMTGAEMIKDDCVYFKGEKPCQFKRLCDECPHFTSFPMKILIIKGRAMGDVLRTTTLLPGLKRKYPKSYISWLVDEESVDLLRHNPLIDRIIPLRWQDILRFLKEEYQVLICLDKEIPSTALGTSIKSGQKFGFGLNIHGNLTIFNEASQYAYRLGLDDDLKFFKNKKTYQEIIYEGCELDYQKDRYIFQLVEEDKSKAQKFVHTQKLKKERPWIGINTGGGSSFETKRWPRERFLELINLLTKNRKATVFLLGGEKEKSLNRWIEDKADARVLDTGSSNTLREFAGLLSLLDMVLTSDSLAMHLALALEKEVIVLFGSTCPQEIELYGQGKKIFAGVDCSPCYKARCSDMKCMKAISAQEVYQEILKLI